MAKYLLCLVHQWIEIGDGDRRPCSPYTATVDTTWQLARGSPPLQRTATTCRHRFENFTKPSIGLATPAHDTSASPSPGKQYARRSLLTDKTAMDFLKSAVASAIAAKGPPFPYNFGDRVDLDESIWTLYNGTKRVRQCLDNNNNPIFRWC